MRTSVLRFLIRGPSAVRSTALRWAVTLLALGGAAFLVWSAVIHLELWSDGYRDIATVGPLFLIASVADIILALLVVAFRRLVVLVAGAGSLAMTAGGLLLSAYAGFFGFNESLNVPYARLSLWVEFGGAAILLVGAALLALAPQAPQAPQKKGQPGNPSRTPTRT
jgi:hypothetical protein